jgi:signal transduction histidine kinase
MSSAQADDDRAERTAEILRTLGQGRLPAVVPDDCLFHAEISTLVDYLSEAHQLTMMRARGDLNAAAPRGRGPVLGALKTLLTNLRHLTWQTQQVAAGDFSQKIDFLGDFSESFNRMIEQLEAGKQREAQLRRVQKLEAVRQLAAGIAHEVNTPIQFVGDNIHFLAETVSALCDLIGTYDKTTQGMSDSRHHDRLVAEVRAAETACDLQLLRDHAPSAGSAAAEGIDRIATIVRALKEFANPEQRDKNVADINRALQSTLVVATHALKDVADVETDFAELPRVACLISEINQVFLGLLINAAHAIHEVVRDSGRRGRIHVRTRATNGLAIILVMDNGCGIPATVRDRIFEPFFTTKPVGSGRGQSLFTAHNIIVNGHGGTITFESEVGVGTTFKVALPIDARTSP